MASSKPGRRKLPINVQKNRLDSYFGLKQTKSDIEIIASDILDEVLFNSVISNSEICASILDEVIVRVCDGDLEQKVAKGKKKVQAHTGVKTTQKKFSEWSEKFPWLIINEDKGNFRLSCKVCQSKKESLKLTNVWASEGSPNIQMSSLIRHNESIEHKAACKSEEQAKAEMEIDVCDEASETDVSISSEDIKLFNTVYFTAKSELPSDTVNGLLQLQVMNGVDMPYKNLSWDSITSIQRSISHVLKSSLVDDIKCSEFYGLMLDESTDITVEKRLSICIRYIKSGEAVTQFLCNVPIEDGKAHTIVNCVIKNLEEFGIPLSSCVSLATDGAAVMMGKKTGVGVQLQSKYAPFCIQTHCVAHRLNLACTDTIKKDEFMKKFRDKFSALYIFMSSSSLRTQCLKRIQKILEEAELTIKEPYSIRWLGLRNAVEAVYESYASVLATLVKFTEEKNPTAKGLLKYFNSYKVALVTALIMDVHTELSVLSCKLQRENLLFSEISPLVDGTLATLESMKTKDGPSLLEMKCRIKVENGEAELSGEKMAFTKSMDKEVENLRSAYLDKMEKNVRDRFKKNDTGIFDDLSKVLEPMTVTGSADSDCDEAIQHLSTFYGYEKRVQIVHGDLVEGMQEEERIIAPLLNPRQLEQEWPRLHGMISGAYSKFSTKQLCRRIIMLHKDILPNCAVLASVSLCLELTSVQCERSFSTQNRLKNKYRSSIGAEKLDILLTISMIGPDLGVFDLKPCIKHWLRKKRRKRRLCSGYMPRVKKQKLC